MCGLEEEGQQASGRTGTEDFVENKRRKMGEREEREVEREGD